jgi:hypothetical protein
MDKPFKSIKITKADDGSFVVERLNTYGGVEHILTLRSYEELIALMAQQAYLEAKLKREQEKEHETH